MLLSQTQTQIVSLIFCCWVFVSREASCPPSARFDTEPGCAVFQHGNHDESL